MELFVRLGVTLEKIPINLINLLADPLWQKGDLHDVSGDGRCDRINEGEATREGKGFWFPRWQLVVEFINDEIVGSFVSFVGEDEDS